jgi:hypothetical protein
MKDSFFWRLIGVGLLAALFMIGYGLCKISHASSPSFSSAAYAQEVTPEIAVTAKPSLSFTSLTFKGFSKSVTIRRAKVIGGWLIAVNTIGSMPEPAITFFPDPKHEWDGGSLE